MTAPMRSLDTAKLLKKVKRTDEGKAFIELPKDIEDEILSIAYEIDEIAEKNNTLSNQVSPPLSFLRPPPPLAGRGSMVREAP